MRKFIYLFMILFLICSCQPDIIDSEKELQNSTIFSYVRVEYVFDKNTYVKNRIKKYPEIVIENNTTMDQTFIDDPRNIFKESSNFWSSDARAFCYIDSLIFVKTPIDEMKDGFVYDGVKWIYSKDEQKRESLVGSFKILQIKPGHKLIIYPCVTLKEIFTTYKLFLKGVERGEELVVSGHWSGTKFLDYSADYIEVPF